MQHENHNFLLNVLPFVLTIACPLCLEAWFLCVPSHLLSAKLICSRYFIIFFFCCMFILSRTCMYNTKSIISYHVTFACRYALFWVDARHSRQEVWKGQPKVGLILFFFKKFKYCVCKYNCWIFYYKLNCSYKY